MEIIDLKSIISEENRKYTRDDGFEQLVESIRTHGLIEPPVLRKQADGGYRVVAGRRRIAAMRRLNEERGRNSKVQAVVLEANDPRSDEEIALSENVNRMDMHPLDEAALFGRMAEKGASIDEIAKHYARSSSAIYQRLRLTSLIEELKGMFRDGILGIGSAAVLAELPEEDQQYFFEQYGVKTETVDKRAVYQFVQKRQRYAIKATMEGCEDCDKRTHNQGNELFDEFSYLSDVCFDVNCYRRKWRDIIAAALARQQAETELPTDAKIYFNGGIPELLYKNADKVAFFNADTSTEYTVLKSKGYDFNGETKKKTGTCWHIHVDYKDELTVRRIGYKEKQPKEKSEAA
jgi:ParB family chromosome partitioning protein